MKQIIEDVNFSKGFALYHTDGLVTRQAVKIFNYGGTSFEYPNWKLAQWCSRYNLANGKEMVYDDYSYEYSDIAKSVRVWRNSGDVKLSLSTSKEYTHPRRDGEGWPHILLEQEFEKDYFLKDIKEAVQEVDFTIESFTNFMSDEDRNNLHTAQFQWFLAIQNRNKESKGYGDFFWFGLPFFDFPRYDYPPAFRAVDGGKEENTGKFINIVDAKEILAKPVRVGERVSVSVPVYEKIKDGFAFAKRNGYLTESEWEDMCIGNMNIGFEVTGTFDVSVMINKLKIFIKEGK